MIIDVGKARTREVTTYSDRRCAESIRQSSHTVLDAARATVSEANEGGMAVIRQSDSGCEDGWMRANDVDKSMCCSYSSQS
jgi:hypothetical protein